MKSEKLLDAIGDIRDEFVEEAAPGSTAVKPRTNWMKYAAFAACFCVCMVGALKLGSLFLPKGTTESAADCAAPEEIYDSAAAETEETAADESAPEDNGLSDEEGAVSEDAKPAEDLPDHENDVAYGFILNDVMYFPISFEDRIHYGLVDENATGLTPENTYQITEADLGEIIGTVEECPGNEDLVGAAVYRFAKFPDHDSICIVETNDSYEFYTSDSLMMEDSP